ncbi:MAG: helix-turn-helix transcriptional regulator [Candidatus Symbiothrix sp.]|jgi:transcriptional regulator with XRE-family HTH domain|nr:helix-turn-helix transcriptional regulator [Candidatus Symbiothrix sp.]
MTTKEKFMTLVSPANEETMREMHFRQENKTWLRKSKRIALKVLLALREQGINQKELAEKMQVSPQYISKLLKGNENLTLETLTKLEDILNLKLLADTTNRKTTDTHIVHIFEMKQVYNRNEFSTYSDHKIAVAS